MYCQELNFIRGLREPFNRKYSKTEVFAIKTSPVFLHPFTHFCNAKSSDFMSAIPGTMYSNNNNINIRNQGVTGFNLTWYWMRVVIVNLLLGIFSSWYCLLLIIHNSYYSLLFNYTVLWRLIQRKNLGQHSHCSVEQKGTMGNFYYLN